MPGTLSDTERASVNKIRFKKPYPHEAYTLKQGFINFFVKGPDNTKYFRPVGKM